MATRLPIFKLDKRKLLAVAMNMAAIVRLENPRRLSNFEESGLKRKAVSKKEKTNIKITTDAAKTTTNTPVIECVNKSY